MARRRRKERSQLDAINEINITPLLDLTFLLLITFMISMPMLETGLGVNTPKMNAKELPMENYKNLSLMADGSLEFDKRKVSREELPAILRRLKDSRPEAIVLLRGDGSRPYDDVISLLRDVRKSGFSNITLVTSQEEGKR